MVSVGVSLSAYGLFRVRSTRKVVEVPHAFAGHLAGMVRMLDPARGWSGVRSALFSIRRVATRSHTVRQVRLGPSSEAESVFIPHGHRPVGPGSSDQISTVREAGAQGELQLVQGVGAPAGDDVGIPPPSFRSRGPTGTAAPCGRDATRYGCTTCTVQARGPGSAGLASRPRGDDVQRFTSRILPLGAFPDRRWRTRCWASCAVVPTWSTLLYLRAALTRIRPRRWSGVRLLSRSRRSRPAWR